MYPDFKELLSALNKHKVKYLVVGGYAVGYHAQPRATGDLDVFIQSTKKNGEAVYRALVEFSAPNIKTLSAADFSEAGTFYRMGVPPIAVDILLDIAGVKFNVAWKSRVVVTLDAKTGLQANFISRDDLIAAKVAAGRPKDFGDVDALRSAAKVGKTAAKSSAATSKAKPRRKRSEP